MRPHGSARVDGRETKTFAGRSRPLTRSFFSTKAIACPTGAQVAYAIVGGWARGRRGKVRLVRSEWTKKFEWDECRHCWARSVWRRINFMSGDLGVGVDDQVNRFVSMRTDSSSGQGKEAD